LETAPDAPQLMNGLRKCVYMHNGVYSAIKKNEVRLFAGKWMELEKFMLSEGSQAQKKKKKNQRSHVFPHTWKLEL
jgi:hypothetical protein